MAFPSPLASSLARVVLAVLGRDGDADRSGAEGGDDKDGGGGGGGGDGSNEANDTNWTEWPDEVVPVVAGGTYGANGCGRYVLGAVPDV